MSRARGGCDAALQSFAGLTYLRGMLETALRTPETAARIADAARRWWDSLRDAQRQRARFPFDADERFVWDYRPVPHAGLLLSEMDAAQRELASTLLAAGLSARAVGEVHAIMALETVLGELEQQRGQSKWQRDPDRYAFALFGEPGGGAPWAWRVGGHHIAVQLTVVEREWIAVTPLFLGANPATVPHGPQAGRRTLAAEEDLARELLARLTPTQQAVAVIAAGAPRDILTGTVLRVDPAVAPRGIAYADLDGAQREQLVRLIRHYVDRAAPEVSSAEWRKIEAQGLDAVTFAWAGALERGRGHYYAVCGSRFVIEYDNTQNDASHIHSVWRDLTNDWGEDLLAAHYAAAHR